MFSNFTKASWVKVAALLTAFGSSLGAYLSGDIMNAVGIVAASLSSINIFGNKKES